MYNCRINCEFICNNIIQLLKIRKRKNDIKIFTLSSLIKNHQNTLFVKLVQDAYFVTECISKDYPKYFEWYWTKGIPRIFNGTGEAIICTINNKIAGVAILKRDKTESKICTFLVVEKYRGKHIATKILEQAFKYLGTTTPLITMSENKAPMFKHIIKKYNWKLTKINYKKLYNINSRELIYNGKLTK